MCFAFPFLLLWNLLEAMKKFVIFLCLIFNEKDFIGGLMFFEVMDVSLICVCRLFDAGKRCQQLQL